MKRNINSIRPYLNRAIVIVAAFMLLSVNTQAQQAPLFSTYFFNKFLNNPGFAGIDNEYRAFGFYRSQWTDIPGSPVTGGATLEGSFWKNRIGAGAYVFNDKIGIFNRTNAALAYNQKIRFAKHHQIGIGVQGGIFVNRVNFSGTNPVDYADPNIANLSPQKLTGDLNLGLSYQWKTLLVGFSVPNVIQSNAEYATAFNTTANYQYVRHYNVFLQYKLALLKGKFNITPTVVMKKAKTSIFQVDASLMLDYNNIVFIGAGYRNSFGVTGLAGVNIMNMFTVAYAYDYTTQRTLKGQVGSTHEITAGFHIATDYKRKKKEEPKDILGGDQSVDDLLAKNDTLSAKLRNSTKKLTDAEKQAVALQETNAKLQRALDSLRSAAAINAGPGAVTGADGNATSTAASGGNTEVAGKGKTIAPATNFDGKATDNANRYVLNDIYFNNDDYKLLPESKKQLYKLVTYMEKNPEAAIIVNGYADNTGGDEYNQKLSAQRAQAVVEYLVNMGIDAKRLASKGYGSQNPVADNNTEEGRKMNRRVEFVVIK